jgi:hypothetical protein
MSLLHEILSNTYIRTKKIHSITRKTSLKFSSEAWVFKEMGIEEPEAAHVTFLLED